MERIRRTVPTHKVEVVIKNSEGNLENLTLNVYGKVTKCKVKSIIADKFAGYSYVAHVIKTTKEVVYECGVQEFVEACYAYAKILMKEG